MYVRFGHSVCIDRRSGLRRGCSDSVTWFAWRAHNCNRAVGLAAGTGGGLLSSRNNCMATIEPTARHGVVIEKVVDNALLCVQVIV